MSDVFEYPYPLEFDGAGDATKFMANLNALANHINFNLQTSKAFTLKYRQVYLGTGKWFTQGGETALCYWKIARTGNIESAGFSFDNNVIVPDEIRGSLWIRNQTGITVASTPDVLTASTELSPATTWEFQIDKAGVTQGEILTLSSGSLKDVAGNTMDGLCVSAWVVVKVEVEV